MTDNSAPPQPETATAPQAAGKKDPGQNPSFRSAALSHRKPTRFRWVANTAARTALATELDLQRISSLSFQGEINPDGRADFRLTGTLLADITQSCVITLAPVEAKIDEQVVRRYIADWKEPDGEEVEIPEDDSDEGLPEVIEIATVVAEALSLALPPYPRAPGAALAETVHTEAGTEALRDEDLKPFAALAQLMKKSQEGGEAGD